MWHGRVTRIVHRATERPDSLVEGMGWMGRWRLAHQPFPRPALHTASKSATPSCGIQTDCYAFFSATFEDVSDVLCNAHNTCPHAQSLICSLRYRGICCVQIATIPSIQVRYEVEQAFRRLSIEGGFEQSIEVRDSCKGLV